MYVSLAREGDCAKLNKAKLDEQGPEGEKVAQNSSSVLDPREYTGFEQLRRAVPGGFGAGRVVVFGASGFLGRYVSALLRGLEVAVVATSRRSRDTDQPSLVGQRQGDRSRTFSQGENVADEAIEWSNVDVTDQASVTDALDRFEPTIVINCSREGFARGHFAFHPLWATNTVGTVRILEALTGHPETVFVQVGSSTEYEPSNSPLSPESPVGPLGDFGRTKAVASDLIQTWAMGFGRRATVVQPFKIYGPGEQSFRFLPRVFQSITDGTALHLVENSRRDYVHAWDVAAAIIRACSAASPEVPRFTVGTGVSHSPRDVVSIVESVTGKVVGVLASELKREPIDVPEWRADTSKMEQIWGWAPEVSLEEGLRLWWQTIS